VSGIHDQLIAELIGERARLRDVIQKVLAEAPVVLQSSPPALVCDAWYIALSEAEHTAVVKAMES
jgi:hypothetical protein